MTTSRDDIGRPSLPEGDEPPPRGVRAMATVRWIFLAVAMLVATLAWLQFARAQMHDHGAAAAQTAKYHCPMHPQIVSDQPGECPICHMSLEPIAPGHASPAASSAPSPIVAKPSPTLAPATPKSPGSMASEKESPTAVVPPGSTPPGTVALHLSLDRVQEIGVRTATAKEMTPEHGLRVSAVVEPPEQGVAEVHVRTPGFVESIAVAQTGVSVKKGQTLLTVYSPELYQAQSELIASKQWAEAAGGPSTPSSARRKLLLLGMSEKDIDRVASKGEPIRAIPVYAPQAGFVAKKSVNLGSYVTPETMLYEIQDLSRVYVVANVFQGDVTALHVGTVGHFTPTRRADVAIEAKVDLVYPTLNAEARTTRVRMQIKNDKQAFSPGEYGTVEFAIPPKKTITVPRDAVVDTGKVTYVFVVESEGQFSPRAVVLGEDVGDDVAIEAGITAGDRVVSGATFLIDSESRLQASIQNLGGPMPSVEPAGTDRGDGPSCDTDFDREKLNDTWARCQKCVKVHHGMGAMEADCKRAIPRPWK